MTRNRLKTGKKSLSASLFVTIPHRPHGDVVADQPKKLVYAACGLQ
jgi:hypothetical protein